MKMHSKCAYNFEVPSFDELLKVVKTPLLCWVFSTGLVDNSSIDKWLSVKADSWLLLPVNNQHNKFNTCYKLHF